MRQRTINRILLWSWFGPYLLICLAILLCGALIAFISWLVVVISLCLGKIGWRLGWRLMDMSQSWLESAVPEHKRHQIPRRPIASQRTQLCEQADRDLKRMMSRTGSEERE